MAHSQWDVRPVSRWVRPAKKRRMIRSTNPESEPGCPMSTLPGPVQKPHRKDMVDRSSDGLYCYPRELRGEEYPSTPYPGVPECIRARSTSPQRRASRSWERCMKDDPLLKRLTHLTHWKSSTPAYFGHLVGDILKGRARLYVQGLIVSYREL